MNMRVLVASNDAALLGLFDQYFKSTQGVEARLCPGGPAVTQCLSEGFRPEGLLLDLTRDNAAEAPLLARQLLSTVAGCKLFVMSGSPEVARQLMPPDLAVAGFIEKPIAFPNLMSVVGEQLGRGRQFGLQYTQFRQPETMELQALGRMCERNPEDPKPRALYAFSLYTAHRLREALVEYAKAVKCGGRTFLNLYYMGQAYSQLAQYESASKCWKVALTMAPSEEEAANVRKRIETVEFMATQ